MAAINREQTHVVGRPRGVESVSARRTACRLFFLRLRGCEAIEPKIRVTTTPSAPARYLGASILYEVFGLSLCTAQRCTSPSR